MVDTRGFNSTLSNIMTELGYASTAKGKGVCKGFSCVWMMIDFIEEEDKLLARTNRLTETPIDKIKQQFAVTRDKVKTKQPLNENDRCAIDDMAFFEAVMMFQNSYQLNAENLFGMQNIQQRDIISVAEQTMPQKLRDMGGMALAYSETGMSTRGELAEQLQSIAKLLQADSQKSSNIKYNFLLGNYNHATVLQYKVQLDCWRVINSNRLAQAKIYKNSQETADEIFAGFPGIQQRIAIQNIYKIKSDFKYTFPEQLSFEEIMKHLNAPAEKPKTDPVDSVNAEYLAYRLELYLPGNKLAAHAEFIKTATEWRLSSDLPEEAKDRITENGITLAYFAAVNDDDITLRKLLAYKADINR